MTRITKKSFRELESKLQQAHHDVEVYRKYWTTDRERAEKLSAELSTANKRAFEFGDRLEEINRDRRYESQKLAETLLEIVRWQINPATAVKPENQ